MIIPALAEKFELFVSRLSNVFGKTSANTGSITIPQEASVMVLKRLPYPVISFKTVLAMADNGQ